MLQDVISRPRCTASKEKSRRVVSAMSCFRSACNESGLGPFYLKDDAEVRCEMESFSGGQLGEQIERRDSWRNMDPSGSIPCNTPKTNFRPGAIGRINRRQRKNKILQRATQ